MKIPPFIILLHISEIDLPAIDQSQSQPGSFPGNGSDLIALRDANASQMYPLIVEELDSAALYLIGAVGHRPADCEDGPKWVPFDIRNLEGSVYQDGVIIVVVFHQLHSAAFVGNYQTGRRLICIQFRFFVPLDGGKLYSGSEIFFSRHDFLETVDFDLLELRSVVVVDANLAFGGAEDHHSAVGGPLHDLNPMLEFLAPQSTALDRAENDCAVLVANADSGSVLAPFHIDHKGFVPVVDHFFKPRVLVQHPNDDQSVLVRCCQLLELLVSGHQVRYPRVPFQSVVQRESTRRLGTRNRVRILQLYHFQQSVLASATNLS